MPKTKRRNLRRTKIRRRKYTKKGGSPNTNLKNKVNKLVRDEFDHAFVIAADIGHSPTAPEEQAKRTLLLRESRKNTKKIDKKSKVTGFELAKKSEGGLASAIKAGYAQGLTAASTVKSRGQSALSTLGGITGALGGPTKIPTSFSNMKQLGSQLLPQQKNTRRRGISTGTRNSSGRRTRTNGEKSGPPGPPSEDNNDDNSGDTPPPPGEISDNLQSTSDELPPPPPESKAEVCPVCSNGVNSEIEIKDITKALKEMAEDKIGDMEDDNAIDKFVENKLFKKIDEVREEVDKKRSKKKDKIKERREKKKAEEKKKMNEKASKLKKRLNNIKGKCLAVEGIEEGGNNKTTTKILTNLLTELEKN